MYQDFPDALDYYVGATGGDQWQARLLHGVYTQFNKGMKHFVEGKHLSPDRARDETRRINDELFKLVIEAAAGILTSGAGITAVNNAIRASSRQVTATAQRTGFARAGGLSGQKIRPVNGKVTSAAVSRPVLRVPAT